MTYRDKLFDMLFEEELREELRDTPLNDALEDLKLEVFKLITPFADCLVKLINKWSEKWKI